MGLRLVGLVALGLATLIAGVWYSGAWAGERAATTANTAIEAKMDAVFVATGDRPGQLRAVDEPPLVAGAEHYEDRATGTRYEFSKGEDRLLYLSTPDLPRRYGHDGMSSVPARSEAIARAAFGVDPAGLDRRERVSESPPQRLKDGTTEPGRVDVGIEYCVKREGVLLPDGLWLLFDGETGRLVSYLRRTRELSVGLVPELSASDAVAVAREELHLGPDVRPDDQYLKVFAPDGGRQQLVWAVSFARGLQVEVDASDGSVVSAPFTPPGLTDARPVD